MKSIFKKYLPYALVGSVLGAILFGVSVRVTDRDVTGKVSLPIPELQPIKDVFQAYRTGGTPVATRLTGKSVVFSAGPRKLSAAENNWAFVRQSATWANGNSSLADNLISALKTSGLISNNSTTSIATTTVIGGVTYKLKLETNNSCNPTTACQNVTASAYSGTKTFTNRFKLWRASDNKDALELLFDDVDNPATGDGVLLTYRLALFDVSSADNEDLVVESYISGASPSRRQTYSWGASFFNNTSSTFNVDRGRVILEEMTIGLKGGGTSSGALCVRIVARTASTTLSTLCGTGNYYYSLAYGQKVETNNETTALSGIAVNALPTNSTFCGFDILKYGTFNGAGFVADMLESAGVPDGYPDPSVNGGYPGVTALFNKIGTAPNGTGTYDDTQKTTIDGLSTISFHPANESPGF